MQREDKKYLHDIQQATLLIQQFAAGHSFDDYLADVMLRSAVERQFEIIGESMTQLARRNATLAARISEYQPLSLSGTS